MEKCQGKKLERPSLISNEDHFIKIQTNDFYKVDFSNFVNCFLGLFVISWARLLRHALKKSTSVKKATAGCSVAFYLCLSHLFVLHLLDKKWQQDKKLVLLTGPFWTRLASRAYSGWIWLHSPLTFHWNWVNPLLLNDR